MSPSPPIHQHRQADNDTPAQQPDCTQSERRPGGTGVGQYECNRAERGRSGTDPAPATIEPLRERVRRRDLVTWGRAAPADEPGPEQIDFASCGVPLPGHEVRIVDAAGRELGDARKAASSSAAPRPPAATCARPTRPQP